MGGSKKNEVAKRGCAQMDAWHWALNACEAAWRCASFFYEAVRALGMLGSMLAVATGLQMGRWGLRMTQQEDAPTVPTRTSQRLGCLLQVCGALLCAVASVAVVRHMVR